MADDDKTEDATPKKVEDAKAEGNVPKSTEVVGAVSLFFGTMYLLFLSSYTTTNIEKMMRFSFGFIGHDIDSTILYSLSYTIVTTLIYSLLPIFTLILILTFISHWSQFGLVMNPLKIDFQKLDPIKGFKGIFALKKLLEALKLALKLTIIVLVMFVLFTLTADAILAMMDKEINASLSTIFELITYFLAAILLIVIIFAIIDFYFTRHYYFESLKMSKQEIKDEHKNMDGDPQVKGRIRNIQMKLARQRMMSNVPDADVVITNPTHYAIAMKYDNKTNSAPKIVAKGIDFIAIKIKDIANENKIPIIENPSLARALYDQIEIEQEIHEEFYKAIAEVFSYVYDLNKR